MDKELIMCIAMYVIIFLWIFICPVLVDSGEDKHKRSRIMSEPRLCCNCLHCARWRKKDGIECHCDLNDKYLGYLTVMDEENDCKHWEKETKWDLQREHDKQIRADAIDEYKIALHTKYKENKDFAYSVWDGNIYKYDAMANLDLEEIDEIAEQLKEQNNE